jgi:hypothetical protein
MASRAPGRIAGCEEIRISTAITLAWIPSDISLGFTPAAAQVEGQPYRACKSLSAGQNTSRRSGAMSVDRILCESMTTLCQPLNVCAV